VGDIVATGGGSNNLQGRIGDIAATGGNIGGFTGGRIGDLSTSGANTLAQFRSDVGDIISGRAQGLNPANVNLGLTAGGSYLDANPYLNSVFNQAADEVARQYRTAISPAIDSAFARSSGALRSGAALNARDRAEENLGKTLGNLATNIYGGNYQAERDRMLAAAGQQGSQYLQGLGLRTSAAGTSAGQGTADASTRLAATGQISGDMSGDVARRLQASNMLQGAEEANLARRLQASGMLQGADQSDAAQRLQANQMLSNTYNAGADRQLQALNAATNAYNAGRAQQLQALGMQPGYMQAQQQMDYNDLNAALEARQQQINADIARWDYDQNRNRNNVNWYLNAINGLPTGGTTSIAQRGSGLGGLGSGISAAANAALLYKILSLSQQPATPIGG
jgi:hypothetical protein